MWKGKVAIKRLLVGYVLLPFVPPILLLLRSWPSSHLALGDWLGIILLYAVFGFAALLFLGTPLLFLYLRLGWTGLLPFMAGGGICAAVTSYAALRNVRNWPLVEFLTVAGVVCGLLLRLILFGVGGNSQNKGSTAR